MTDFKKFEKGDRVRNKGLLAGFIHYRVPDGAKGTVVEKNGSVSYETNGGDTFVWVEFDSDSGGRVTSLPAKELEHID